MDPTKKKQNLRVFWRLMNLWDCVWEIRYQNYHERPYCRKKSILEVIFCKVHFASLMDICHLKNAALEAKHQKYKGRVVLRGDIVQDNSGSCAVFTEQGSSASQMTAAKIMDIISRLPGCDGQATDAVSAHTKVKMEDAHRLFKIPNWSVQNIWIRPPRHKWPESWSSMEDPIVPLVKNLKHQNNLNT